MRMAGGHLERRWFLPIVLGLALATCAAMTVIHWDRITGLNFRDTDDALRLVEVRQFLAGQSWFDVSQYRIDPPFGTSMHWSRLVDLPIAGLILLFTPLAGTGMAERIASAIVPLMLTVALFVMFALAARRIGGERVALVSSLLLCFSVSILIQFHPMRIDHHNWQILMAAVTLWATFDPQPRRGGTIAGLAVAFWLHVSAEAMPYVALFGGLYGLRVIARAAEWPRLLHFAATLALGSFALLLGVRGWPAAATYWCDAMSPTFLWPLFVVALMLPLGSHLIGEHSPVRRLLVLAIAAVAGAGTYLLSGRQCLGGPFEALDPLVYNDWYLFVSEGRPLWEQSVAAMLIVIAPLPLGLVGGLIAMRSSPDRTTWLRWVQLMFLALGAFAIAMVVMRAITVAHLLLLPGAAVLLIAAWKRARAITATIPRILATTGLFVLTPIGAQMLLMPLSGIDMEKTANSTDDMARRDCSIPEGYAALAALPTGIIFAPLDIGPFVLAFTPHSVIATGHHRANLAMREVIRGFRAPADQARTIVTDRNADYVAYCPGWKEVRRYTSQSPNGLLADLEHNRPPAWLRPVPMPASQNVRVYRVIYPAGTKRMAKPFMQ
ncbi:MAG: hypothetical protein DI547_11690 [Sphingobium sp.]|nr:MAG: hypothetical protein DI547_11690 [Sphingobium sp.]